MTCEEQAYANHILASWLAESHRPFNLVNDPGFHRYVKYVESILNGDGLRIPSRTKVTNDVINLASQLRASLMLRLRQDCECFHATTDIWSDRAARSYISLTIHYFEEDFNLNEWVLNVQPIPGKHDAGAIARAIRKILDDWSLQCEACGRLVRDGASNGVAAAHQLRLKASRALHTLSISWFAACWSRRRRSVPVCDRQISRCR